jgi:hypothetical protein
VAVIDETTRRAIGVLRSVWGSGNSLSAHDARFLEAHEQPGETALDTCARLAGADVRGLQPYDHRAFSRAAALADLAAVRGSS